MSHIDIDIIDFILLTVYPVLLLLIIEIIHMALKFHIWLKLLIQALTLVIFGVVYIAVIESHWFTALVLFSLSAALLYQSKKSKYM